MKNGNVLEPARYVIGLKVRCPSCGAANAFLIGPPGAAIAEERRCASCEHPVRSHDWKIEGVFTIPERRREPHRDVTAARAGRATNREGAR